MTIFDLPAAAGVALVALVALGFLALSLYSGVRVAVQTALLLGASILVGIALGWAVMMAGVWIVENFQMAIGLLVGFVIGCGSSFSFLVIYLIIVGGSKGQS